MGWLLYCIAPGAIALLFVALAIGYEKLKGFISSTLEQKLSEMPPPVVNLPDVNVDATVDTTEIRRDLEEMKRVIPEFVLQSLMGTANTQKGKLGEIIGYLSLKAEYDRIIPLGTIVDFLAIKFPSGEEPGYIDLIDVKTGKSARLSPDQRKLRDLVNTKQINFKTIKIEELDGLSDEYSKD